MSKNNCEQKEKPLAGISSEMACGSKKEKIIQIGSPLVTPFA